MQFKKFVLQDIQEINVGVEVMIDHLLVTKISDEFVEKRRWYMIYEMIFKIGDQFFSSEYSLGSTEEQDMTPYEDEPNMIECEEVFPVEVTTVQYLPKK